MRRPVDRERLGRFLRALGQEVGDDVRVYLTGGATAVLYGWRTSTIDIDLKPEPEADSFFRALPALKERLEINVELPPPTISSRSSPAGASAALSSPARDGSPSTTTTFTPKP